MGSDYFPPTIENRGTLQGPLLVATMLACALFGITLLQSVYYYRTYPGDHYLRKGMVAFVLFLEGCHLGLLWEEINGVYVDAKLPENAAISFAVRPTYSATFAFTSFIIPTTVQTFYAWRVWMIAREYTLGKIAVGFILFTSFIQFAAGVTMDVFLFLIPTLDGLYTLQDRVSYSTHLTASMACDITISASLIYFLNRSRSGFRRTENMINRLVIYSLNIGLVTSAFALATFVAYHAFPSTLLIGVFSQLNGKVYANSFLVTLNARNAITKTSRGTNSDPLALSVNTSAFKEEA